MEVSIYLDVLFFWECSTNLFLLYATGCISGFCGKKSRIFFGAVVSALLHCLQVYYFGVQSEVWQGIGILLIGLAVAYLPKSLRNFARLFLCLMVANFLLGGAVQLLLTFTNAQTYIGEGIFFRSRVTPWYTLFWGIVAGYFLLKWGGRWIETHLHRRSEVCTIAIVRQGKKIEICALIDTGNELKKDGKGVAIVQFSSVMHLFLAEEVMEILGGNREMLQPLCFSSLGNVDATVWGFLAEELQVYVAEEVVMQTGVFVCVTFDDFSGAYEALIPPSLLKEGSR